MGQALLGLLPLALAAALSTVPVTAAIFILLSDSRRRSGLAFLGGTLLGTLVVVMLATLASRALPGRTRQHDALIGQLEIVIGAAMVLLGVVTLVRRTDADAPRGLGWLDGIGSLGILSVLGIALALCIRPKAGLLALAAGLAINRANLALEEELVLVVLYTVLGTSTVRRSDRRDDPLPSADGASPRRREAVARRQLHRCGRGDHDPGGRLRHRPRHHRLSPLHQGAAGTAKAPGCISRGPYGGAPCEAPEGLPKNKDQESINATIEVSTPSRPPGCWRKTSA